jgi:hypothetical protein
MYITGGKVIVSRWEAEELRVLQYGGRCLEDQFLG